LLSAGGKEGGGGGTKKEPAPLELARSLRRPCGERNVVEVAERGKANAQEKREPGRL